MGDNKKEKEPRPIPAINKRIGTGINSALARKETQQNQLADMIGEKNKNMISYYCKGSRVPNHEQMIKIADALDVDMDSLYLRKHESTDNDMAAQFELFTGLSAKAVSKIRDHKDNTYFPFLSAIFEDDLLYAILEDIDMLRSSLNVLQRDLNVFRSNPEQAGFAILDYTFNLARAERFEIQEHLMALIESIVKTDTKSDVIDEAKELLAACGALGAFDQQLREWMEKKEEES